MAERELRLAEAKLTAEKQAREREVQLADEKLAAEQRARAKQRQFTRVVATVAVLALAGLGVEGWLYLEIKKVIEQLESTKIAEEKSKQEADQTRKKLGESERENNDSKVKNQLKEIDKHILHLEYKVAFEKCKTALDLKVQPSEVKKRVEEIAFFYTEANMVIDAIQALNLIDSTDILPDTFGAQKILRNKLKEICTKDYLDSLDKRYFPTLILVNGKRRAFLKNWGKKRMPAYSFKIAETETTVWQYFLYQTAIRSPLIEKQPWGGGGR